MGPGAVPPGVIQLERVKENHQAGLVWGTPPGPSAGAAGTTGMQAQTTCVVWVPQTVPRGCLAPITFILGLLRTGVAKKEAWGCGERRCNGAVVMGQVMGLGDAKVALLFLQRPRSQGYVGTPKTRAPPLRRAAQEHGGAIRDLGALGSVWTLENVDGCFVTRGIVVICWSWHQC